MSVQPHLLGLETHATRVSVPSAERQKALSQWYTDSVLAERVWRWMDVACSPAPMSVLEPSCGLGALIKPLSTLGIPVERLVAYDIDPDNAASTAALLGTAGFDFEVRARDFLADPNVERFDISVMNPPYEDGLDVAFATRALEHCERVAGIFAARMLFADQRSSFWRWTDIDRLVVLSARPRFGGGFSPMTDFVVLEISRRCTPRKQGEPSTTRVEWW
jgi:predicted RNA methylase